MFAIEKAPNSVQSVSLPISRVHNSLEQDLCGIIFQEYASLSMLCEHSSLESITQRMMSCILIQYSSAAKIVKIESNRCRDKLKCPICLKWTRTGLFLDKLEQDTGEEALIVDKRRWVDMQATHLNFAF